MSGRLRALGLAAVLVGCAAEARAVIGLSTQFVNVVMENLEPGRSYNLRELRGIPYTVKNRGDGAVDVIVEVTVPVETEIIEPYEPIPDPTWMQVVPGRFRLGAGEPGFSDLIITIPDDKKYVGRHFQAMVWAHTVGTGFMAAGVKSHIRFTVGKGPETLAEQERQKAMVELNYDLWPAGLHVMRARPGKYDVKAEEKRSHKLTNRSEKPLELVLRAAPWSSVPSALPKGYEAPTDLSWVKFEPETVKVEPESLKDIRMMLDVPEALKGKKNAFLVQLTLPIGTIVNMSNTVYVQVE